MSSIAQKALEQEIKTLKDKFKEHLDGYMAHVLSDLNQTIDSLIDDYETRIPEGCIDTGTGTMEMPVESLERAFLTGKASFKDCLEEFWDHGGETGFDKYEDLDTALDELAENIESQLKDDESEEQAMLCDGLKTAAENYRMSDHQYHQDQLLRILEDEYGLKLIVAPAGNQ